ncbi:GTP:AMP phosphotransferase AK3, mitochondrial [Diachasma alloeum]|uniref:GTP:AMP phosphotransferase AK3, mitochondrial n=1 Tax=Diachasma alloeum TaxID=454923 RepID=UPI0007381CD0|nr:GTP:AMP phosphotransferase AK3, mitochondrial [Diachasma alloeum]XP_015124352.1 GTP:AMP phosphotransferase AK3, mitochondrial [Diachasma alloeum]
MVKLYTSLAYPKAFRSIILGAPASGKGTVSSRIVNCFGVTHISSGDKLRDHVARQTEVGKRVKKYMDEGSFVPDDVIIELISQELKSVRDKNILLDGFPRTVAQAEKLQQLHPMNHVLNLIVPHSMIMERVKNRWVHLPSGRVYNVGFNDPKVLGRDDVTGEKLSQRNDDKPDVVAKRLTDYVMKTEKVIEYYRQLGILKEFEGDTTDEMWPKIKTFISQCIDGNK